MLVLSRREVEALLDLDLLIEAVARPLADLSAGTVSMPARVAAVVPDRGSLLAMPAYLPSIGALTTKLVGLFPRNEARGLPSHVAVVLAFDPETGAPVALMDGEAITAARTAAGSALATRLLARPEASVLAILGTGVQARAHARAVPRVWPIREIRVAGRAPGKVRALADEIAAEWKLPVRPAGSYSEALAGADIVCATTHSPEPVVRREWIGPGVHVNSVGFSGGTEVDAATVRDALVVLETRQAAVAPYPAGANEIAWPIRDGVITGDHVHAELGEIVAGTRPGRTSPERITLYKSIGVAVQDAAAAALVLGLARERGLGSEIEI
ncbi:MAG TPA: ornithine cyclodeaminase family protein [Dehalococcoidia bacterium]|nr:ornithine cyclodeaminase family protein [Dehalococcoidia bacterium]